jgi:hypothetical protein
MPLVFGFNMASSIDSQARDDRPRRTLQDAIANQGLDEFESRVLEELGVDAHGLDRLAAPGFIASLTNRPMEESSDAIISLLGRGLLVAVDDAAGVSRLFVNYAALGIDDETRLALLAKPASFTTLGSPHSERAMETLAALLREERGPIYLGIEVTSRKVFKELDARASEGRKTIFLLPRKQDVRSELGVHYDEVIRDWIAHLKDGASYLRRNIELRVTQQPFPYLFTSALTSSRVRLDVFSYEAGTTRQGEIIETQRGSSLYDLAFAQFREAHRDSRPLRQVWPGKWLLAVAASYWIAILFIALAGLLTWFGGGAALFGSSANFSALAQRGAPPTRS